MIGKIIGAVAGAKAVKGASGIKRPHGALLGVGAAAALRRFAPIGLVAAALGGYALKRHAEKSASSGNSEHSPRSSSMSEKLALGETPDLISSEKVDGTAVYNREGEKLGAIHHFMVGKRDGRVYYAVMSFGGLFGMGVDHYPLPWGVLD